MLTVIEKYDRSVVKREMSNRKIYLYDTGLTSVTTTSLTEDRGKILENIIFSHLRQMDVQVFLSKIHGNAILYVFIKIRNNLQQFKSLKS
jgi:hypothetical protein